MRAKSRQDRSSIAADIQAFLKFKRTLGYRYSRAEFTLRVFVRFLGQCPASKNRPPRLDQAILAWLARCPDRKAVTVAQEMAVIRQFWDYLRRHYPRKYSREIHWPVLPIKSNFKPYVLSRAQIRSLLKRIDHWEHPSDSPVLIRTIFLVLYCTGLRFGEVVRLRVQDVDLRRQVLWISESKGRSRWVPFHPSLGKELQAYLKKRKSKGPCELRPDDRFFIRSYHRELSVSWISGVLRELLRQEGLKPSQGRVGPRPYDLRHTFAVHRLTRWYRQGIDLDTRLTWLSAYMGHVNLAGTETYLTATPELLALAAHRFNRHYRAGRGHL